ncbi:MAG: hypothetical protein NZ765_04275 [Anaerolineae bacterium]|nr:hypothetical protein [Anaerolineae bacterium]MDW8070626.1 hypothetical protein [Anaerolineae bacterium]
MEFCFTPSSGSDTRALQRYAFDLPEGAWLIGDKAHHNYTPEDIRRDAQLYLLPYWRQNTNRPLPSWLRYLQSVWRGVVKRRVVCRNVCCPKSIHSVTARGFELKLTLFLLACTLSFLW